MIVVAPAFEPGGPWMLPAEMTDPSHYQLMSPSAQQILEARGLSGYGAAAAPYGWRRGMLPVSSGIQIIQRNPLAGYGQRMTWAQFANRVLIP